MLFFYVLQDILDTECNDSPLVLRKFSQKPPLPPNRHHSITRHNGRVSSPGERGGTRIQLNGHAAPPSECGITRIPLNQHVAPPAESRIPQNGHSAPPGECGGTRPASGDAMEARGSSSSEGSPWHPRVPLAPGESATDSNSTLEREIAALNQEMEHIKMECQEIIESHVRDQGAVKGAGEEEGTSRSPTAGTEPFKSPRMVPKMGTRMDYMKQVHAMQEGQEPPWVKYHHYEEIPAHYHDHCDKDKKGQSTGEDGKPDGGGGGGGGVLTLELKRGDGDGDGGNSLLTLNHNGHHTEPQPEHMYESIRNGSVCNGDDPPPLPPPLPLPRSPHGCNALPKSTSSNSVSKLSQTDEEMNASLQELYTQYADVMYTNTANLQHTIMVQQKLFQQQLAQRAWVQKRRSRNLSLSIETEEQLEALGKRTNSQESSKSQESSPSHKAQQPQQQDPPTAMEMPSASGGDSKIQMEWVVKRRADGSRYITRRPIRSKLLKERAKKVAEERTGMTTDDDAMSELKVGRYWPKGERKRHLEKARDHKRKKEQLKQKMEGGREVEETRKEPTAVDLGHKKMMRHKGKKVLDDFVTLQEMLAHGSREPEVTTYNPLLSVTTV